MMGRPSLVMAHSARIGWLAAPLMALACSSGGGSAADSGPSSMGGGGESDSGGAVGSGGDDGGAGGIDAVPADEGSVLGDTATPADTTVGADGFVTDGPDVNEQPGVFVVVGYGGRRARSLDDGQTWVDDMALMPNGTDDQTLLRAVSFGDQGFLAVGYRVMASLDGKTWIDHGATLNQWLGAVVRGQGLFIAVGGFGLRVSSPDGVTWKRHDIDTIASHAGSGLLFVDGAGQFVSTNDSGQRAHSPDGMTWTYATGADGAKSTLLAQGNGVLVGVGGTDVVISRDGGLSWTVAPSLTVAAQSVVFARGHFTVVANGHLLMSSDGQAWSDQAVAGVGGGSLAYGHGTYVLVDNTGAVRRSVDGVAWTATLPRGTNGLAWVAFGPGLLTNQK
ncbi:MAG TPA: hypothetical protein VGL59_07030 [Polyangia bacterium]|jgi:hypothetical protein